jgi:dihydrofolate reductase
MGAVVSLDGFIADDNDGVGPLFDWYGNGDVSWSFEGSDGEARTTQASADFMRAHYADIAVVVIGRRLFDLTNGWDGKPTGSSTCLVARSEVRHWGSASSTRSSSILFPWCSARDARSSRQVPWPIRSFSRTLLRSSLGTA